MLAAHGDRKVHPASTARARELGVIRAHRAGQVRGCRVVRPAAGAVRLEAFGPGGGGAGTAAFPFGFFANWGGWLGEDEGLLAALAVGEPVIKC